MSRRVVTAAAVLLLLSGCREPGSDDGESPASTGDSVVLVGPTEMIRGVPRGWRHDDAGARAAALAYVALTGEVARAGFITRGDLISSLATPGFRRELEAETIDQLDETIEDLRREGVAPDQLVWSELPLTAHVATSDGAEARVEVWSVVVIGLPTNDSVPRQTWRTVTIDLAWVESDWLVSGWDASSGPTPALGPDAVIDPLDELATVVAWPPAYEGVS